VLHVSCHVYGVIQEEKSVFWDVTVLAIVRKIFHMNTCVTLNGYRGKAVWIYKYKGIVNGNKEGEITYCLFYFNSYLTLKRQFFCSSQRMLVILTVNLSALCNSCAKIMEVDLHVSSCGRQDPKCNRAIRLVYSPLFCKLSPSSDPKNKNLTKLCLEFQRAQSRLPFRIRHTYVLSFFFRLPILSSPKCWSFLLNHPVYVYSLSVMANR